MMCTWPTVTCSSSNGNFSNGKYFDMHNIYHVSTGCLTFGSSMSQCHLLESTEVPEIRLFCGSMLRPKKP